MKHRRTWKWKICMPVVLVISISTLFLQSRLIRSELNSDSFDFGLKDANSLQARAVMANQVPANVSFTNKALSGVSASSSISRLMQLLHDDPENYAYRDITFQDLEDGGECFFSGLNEELLSSVYLNRRIAFVGDSTLRRLSWWLNALLMTHGVDDFPLLRLTDAVERVKQTAVKRELNFQDKIGPRKKEGMLVDFQAFGDTTLEGRAENETLVSTTAMHPDVIVASMGLDLLHFHGFGQRTTSNQIINWFQYEDWLQACVDSAVESGAKLLIFKKTNKICESEYVGLDEEATKKYQSNDPETLRICERRVRTALEIANYSASESMISLYCTNGTLTQTGANSLNERMLQFVKDTGPISNLEITILDDPSVESCSYTSDGRHFGVQSLMRIRLLGNIIASFFGDTNAKSDTQGEDGVSIDLLYNETSNRSMVVWRNQTVEPDVESMASSVQDRQSFVTWPRLSSADPMTCDNLLIQLLHDDPDRSAYRDVTIQASEHFDECFFSGLDEELLDSVFRHRRIVLFGDSTLRRLSKWLHALLETDGVDDFPFLTLEEGNSKVKRTASAVGIDFSDKEDRTPITNGEGMHIEFNGIGGTRGDEEAKLLEEAWARTKEVRPEVLVVNMGMHWLHFQAAGKSGTSNQIMRWIQYENWLQECLQHAIESGVKLLIYKKTNLICESDYYGRFEEASELYHSKDAKTLRKCKNDVETRLEEAEFLASKSMISNYCRYGMMTHVGAAHLNERLVRFVESLPAMRSLNVTVFDDSRVESCNFTSDGRHFSPLNGLRIRLLGNVIHSFLGRKIPESNLIPDANGDVMADS